MKVAILTEEQKQQIDKQELCVGMRFNPIEQNGKWIISQQEIDSCVVEEFMWVKDLELTDWVGRYIINK